MCLTGNVTCYESQARNHGRKALVLFVGRARQYTRDSNATYNTESIYCCYAR